MTPGRPVLSRLTALILSGAVSACAPMPVAMPPAPVPVAVAPPPETPQSAAMRVYFAQVQATLQSRGLLRTDSGSGDAPYSDRMLAEAFLRIALYDEFQAGPGGYVAQETESILRRWQGPVRVSLRFGPSVPEARRATERARVGSYLARLSGITGHPIRLSESAPNFFIYIVSEDERQALGPEIAATMPGLQAEDIRAFTIMPPTTYCQVSVESEPRTGVYSRAFAVIRSEHADLMSQLCLHEEVAQGLGLPNDSPRARPSIFNDDQEFALLTPMDEAMLRILYNPALRPGLSLGQARPVVEALARAMTGGGA